MTRKRTTGTDQSRTATRRPETVSSQSTNRGQTTQDYAVGIGVFLLAIAFVFSFLPTVMMPFDSSVSSAETAQADRIAGQIIDNMSTGTGNEINASKFKETYTSDDLRTELGLRQTNGHAVDQVNVTVEYLGNETIVAPADEWSGGDTYNNQSAASSARIITIDDGSDGGPCDTACRLVVRIW